MGVVRDHQAYNMYLKVVYEEVRTLPGFEWLKEQGIVSGEGKNLDEQGCSRYKRTLLNKQLAEKKHYKKRTIWCVFFLSITTGVSKGVFNNLGDIYNGTFSSVKI